MNDDKFWEIIDLLDWSQDKPDKLVLPAINALSQMQIHDIFRFEDNMTEKLFYLDSPIYAEHAGETIYYSDNTISADRFLYARCFVVASGKKTYETVLSNPSQFTKNKSMEALLHIAEKAYKKVNGTEMEYLPLLSYETFSNETAWGSVQNS